MTHELEILEPIWKNRSIGVALHQVHPDDLIKITIAYKKKDGELAYPDAWLIKAVDVHRYPIKHKKKGIGLHEVPIADLYTLDQNLNNSTNQKQHIMLFDNKDIDKIRKENAERSGGDSRKTIEAGEQVVAQGNARVENAKKDGNPMIILDFQKSPEYKPLTTYWKLAGSGSEIAKKQIIEYLERAFGYVLQPCKDEQDVLKQIAQFNGKNLKIAVRTKDSLWDNKEGETVVVTKAEFWYAGSMNDNKFSVEPSKMHVALEKEELKRYNDITSMTGVPPRKAGEKAPVVAENTTKKTAVAEKAAEDDGLPF